MAVNNAAKHSVNTCAVVKINVGKRSPISRLAFPAARPNSRRAAAAQIATEIDFNAAREPVLALDLMTGGDVRGLIAETAGGGAIAMLLNRGDSPARVQTSDLKSGAGATVAIDLAVDGEIEIFDTIELPPHSARILRINR